jgi:peptidoglycan hydrolase-like protein with peptidoglycan-binding domain
MTRADRAGPRIEAGSRKKRKYWAGMLATGALGAAVAATVATAQPGPGRHLVALGAGSPGGAATTAGAATGTGGGATTAPAGPATSPSTTTPAPATTVPPTPSVLSVNPPPGATGVAASSPITVVLSSPPAPGAPMPSVSPPVAGQWSVQGAELTFTPSAAFQPWATETVTVPAGLASPRAATFQVEGVTLLRSQQLLAELGYLPLRFGPSSSQSNLDSEATTAGEVSTAPQPGAFTWRFPDIPSSLAAAWSPGQANVATEGAVMSFESQHGLAPDGVVGPDVWKALTGAVAARQVDLSPYDYLMVSEALPESLVVWSQGKDVYQTPVNTGVPGATTAVGTYPVYERFQTTTMVGTDVDGAHYDVSGVPWVAYFNGGDAVHGYWRSGYGYPQSNGCVELPISNAKVVWAMDPIGTLVNVSG